MRLRRNFLMALPRYLAVGTGFLESGLTASLPISHFWQNPTRLSASLGLTISW